MTGTARAALWMTLAAVGFAVLTSLVRYLSSALPPMELALLRSFFLFILMMTWRRWDFSFLKTSHPKLHLLRGISGALAMMGIFHGVAHLPLGYVTALTFAAPLFATIGAALFLGEVVRLRRWLATGIGFIGTLIILWPAEARLDMDSLITLGAAMAMATTMVLIRKMSHTESPDSVVAWSGLSMTVALIIPGFWVWHWPTLAQWGWVVLIGLAALGIQQSFARALKVAEASVVMPFDFLRLLATIVAGFILFAEVPQLRTLFGAALIMASTFYIARREARSEKAARAAATPPPHS